MITKAVYERWLDALRSGKYQQGFCRLRSVDPSGDRHCCLGVLCDVVDPDGWEQSPEYGWIHRGGVHYPSRAVIVALAESLPARIDRRNVDESASWWVSRNDSGESFADIADRIEELTCNE